ncbi:LysR family transcriptional regulator [Microvirga subterranea]|uniref:DNA-binding transcriptional LysR family regulator n=1 Tax=Microvirga subterranea TaxID=186651 RepID=A0A370HCQ4_9HYPH|nr:LysR family transcriptional regulator [Microvirga subterranea]RDI54862.1 DNA-binding transcriptional LysR family regulator [Microvirga subterranea]
MNFAAFDLNLIHVFDALMRERSVTRAGEALGLSQPAVSAALNRLRHLLDDQLFVRRGNDMVPTPRAENLAEPIRDALGKLESALAGDRTFDPGAAERTFTLLGADFFSMLLMPDLATRIAAKAPKIALRFLDSAKGDITRLLQEDSIDAALERPLTIPDWIATELLFASPFAIIAPAGHPALAGKVRPGSAFPLDLFCEMPHAIRSIDGSMQGYIDDALSSLGRKRRVSLALPHFQSVALVVAKGKFIAAVPSQFAHVVAPSLNLAVFEPPIPVPIPEIKLYWHNRHTDNPAHRWLRQQILESVRAIWSEPDDQASS